MSSRSVKDLTEDEVKELQVKAQGLVAVPEFALMCSVLIASRRLYTLAVSSLETALEQTPEVGDASLFREYIELAARQQAETDFSAIQLHSEVAAALPWLLSEIVRSFEGADSAPPEEPKKRLIHIGDE